MWEREFVDESMVVMEGRCVRSGGGRWLLHNQSHSRNVYLLHYSLCCCSTYWETQLK